MKCSAVLAMLLALVLLSPAAPAMGGQLDFTVTEKGQGGPVVLVIGGIQGDEPGGFSAAALLATQYTFTSGTVRIVPNLNFPSIIERSRGLHGDMNRKFADLSDADPEYQTVRNIQQLIIEPDVGMILNLHDGSGFYRPVHESSMRNPSRWGQSVIIDQIECPSAHFGQLGAIADRVVGDVNSALLHKDHAIAVRNTRTGLGDHEMDRSLTWFALRNGKSAFGLEASKEFDVSRRVYYHLSMVEAFLAQAGVTFERAFPLTPAGIERALGRGVTVSFAGNRLVLPLDDMRRSLNGRLPLPRGAEESANSNMPIVAVVAKRDALTVHYGNKAVTSFRPDWMDVDDQPPAAMRVRVDGKALDVPFGALVQVNKQFLVERLAGYRVNIIGATLGNDESDMNIRLADCRKDYSIDKAGKTYRVEVYKENAYVGTFLARFGPAVTTAETVILPAVPGRESDLGW